MLMYAWYIAVGAEMDFTVHDMVGIRRWWCATLVENFQLEGYGRRFAHFTPEGQATLSLNVPPVFRVSRKRRHQSITMTPGDVCDEHSYAKKGRQADAVLWAPGTPIFKLPPEILEEVLLEVVLQEGDMAYLRLTLTCRAFRDITGNPSFRKRAHFAWLDGEVNWKNYPAVCKEESRVPFAILNCQECGIQFKDCVGFTGNGKRGEYPRYY
ncbi:uncharacterized protein LOC143316287 [Chaetodon auriga]|uniref:uncharacterized protein LOC143316287 n=1 Tax=Chaetodon auriga TaxID=39042 RepID=UPI004032DD66